MSEFEKAKNKEFPIPDDKALYYEQFIDNSNRQEGADWACEWIIKNEKPMTHFWIEEAHRFKAENAELKENQSWLISALQNFCPFNGDLPEGLDSTMYQTLSYEGDKKLLDKFNKIKQTNEGG